MNAGRILRSFKTKIIIAILAVGILAVFIGLSVVYWIGREQLQQQIGAEFKAMAHETSRKLVLFLDNGLKQAQLLAMATEIRDTVAKANQTHHRIPLTEQEIRQQIDILNHSWNGILGGSASQYTRRFLNDPSERAEHISIILTDNQGFLVGADAKPRSLYYGDQDWWQAAYNQGRGSMYISDIQRVQPATSEFEQVYALGLAVPVMDQTMTRAIGILRTDVQVKHLFEAVTGVRIGETDHSMLASSDGSLIFCPIFLIQNHTLRPEFMEAIRKDQPGWTLTTADVHYSGRPSINGFSPVSLSNEIHPASLGGKKWFVFTSQNPDETYSSINTLQNWMAASGIIGAIALSFIGVWAAGFIVKPLKNLQMGARLIGYGNLDHRLDLRTGDEIEELAHEFNEMAIKLKASYSGLEAKVAERTKELAVVNKINRIISSSLNLKLIFETFTEEVGKLLDFDRISMALMDESGEYIQNRMVKTRGAPLIARDSPLRPKTGTVVGWVVDKAQPLIRLDTMESQQFVEDRLTLKEGFRSYIAVPIVSKRKPIGALLIVSARPQTYSERNLEILMPIAEQMAIAIETIRLFEQTKKLDQLKSEFVSKVSHELRTPLTSIKGFTEILLSYEGVDPKTQKEFLGIINEESERLTRLINDILDLSKIEAGKIEWLIQPVEIRDIAEHTVKLFRSLALEKNIELVVQVPPNLPAVRGDRDQLLQVMDNLLSNAIKFTVSEMGKITIKVHQENAFVKVSVSDTGMGIPEEDQSKIFKKFHQIGDVRSGKPRGTGLGLAICKEIIGHLGGRIWCESEPDKGSTFYFTLPVWSKDLRYVEPLNREGTDLKSVPRGG